MLISGLPKNLEFDNSGEKNMELKTIFLHVE